MSDAPPPPPPPGLSPGLSPVLASDIATIPSVGVSGPTSFSFSAGSLLYLQNLPPAQTVPGSPPPPPVRTLLSLDLSSLKSRPVLPPPSATTAAISLSEQMRLERLRLHARGVSEYIPTANRTIVVIAGSIYLVHPAAAAGPARSDSGHRMNASPSTPEDVAASTLVPIYEANTATPSGVISGDGAASDVSVSPDENLVFFTTHNQLFVVTLSNASPAYHDSSGAPLPPSISAPLQLTTSSHPLSTNGVPDFLAAEEMDLHRGYWLVPSTPLRIAYLATDNSPVPPLTLQHPDLTSETHYYPFAGKENPAVELRFMELGFLQGEGAPTPEQAKAAFADSKPIAPPDDCVYVVRVNVTQGGVVSAHQTRDQKKVVLR